MRYIANHPLNRGNKLQAIKRYVKWQLRNLIDPSPSVCNFGEKSRLIIKKGMTGATGNLYCGLHEFEDMAFVLHFLRETDNFIDVGANVGTYTILAAGERNVNTVSFEPVPETMRMLIDNVRINGLEEKVELCNIAVGSKEGVLKFTKSLDAANHVATDVDQDVIHVKVAALDQLVHLKGKTVIKIDVEGYELEVLTGMTEILADDRLEVIIMELNDSGLRYGYTREQLHETMLLYRFSPYRYDPFKRKIVKLSEPGSPNTIYIRDYDFARTRVQSADAFRVNGCVV